MNKLTQFKPTPNNEARNFLKFLKENGYSRKSLQAYNINAINNSLVNLFINLSQIHLKEFNDVRSMIWKNKIFITDEYVENVINIPENNFDFFPYIQNNTHVFTSQRINKIKKLYNENNNYKLNIDFNRDFKLITDDIKKMIFRLTGDERYQINRFLSLAYLVGDIEGVKLPIFNTIFFIT